MNLTTSHPQQPDIQPLNVSVLDTVVSTVTLASEVWTRDDLDANLWHGPHGVIVNTAALEERKRLYQLFQMY